MAPAITPRQREVLEFVRQFRAEHGFGPSYAEMASGLGLRSSNAVAQHVRLLIQKGALQKTVGVARSLRPLDLIEEDAGLPLIGEVAAGEPIFAEAHIERRLTVDPSLFRRRADYLLRVRGDSMIEAGICPGDLVAVHAQKSARNNDVVVVRLGDEVTVKRWRRDGREVLLEPANAALRPRRIDLKRESLVVEGLVVGLLRLDLQGSGRR